MNGVEGLLRFMMAEGIAWAAKQQAAHRPRGRQLSQREKATYETFFSTNTLEKARVVSVPVIENPDFFAQLAERGVPPPIDFRLMDGITFIDTILISNVRNPGQDARLIFHELVHVVQYEALGLTGFMNAYVMGWAANGFTYEGIPLERQAYRLQAHFDLGLDFPVDIEEEVRKELGSLLSGSEAR